MRPRRAAPTKAARSLAENEEVHARRQQQATQLDRQLGPLERQRVPAPPFGNCQFEAIVPALVVHWALPFGLRLKTRLHGASPA